MKIHLLGCGTPTSDAERFGSSYVVEIAGQHIMFDCGPSTTSKLVKAGLRPTWVDYLFFTHHHFDHDAIHMFDGRQMVYNFHVFHPVND